MRYFEAPPQPICDTYNHIWSEDSAEKECMSPIIASGKFKPLASMCDYVFTRHGHNRYTRIYTLCIQRTISSGLGTPDAGLLTPTTFSLLPRIKGREVLVFQISGQVAPRPVAPL